MGNSPIINIGIGLVVLVFIMRRQLRTRPAKADSVMKIFALLAGIGLIETIDFMWTKHSYNLMTIIWIIASLVAAGLLGIWRAQFVKVWRSKSGTVLVKGSWLTVALWMSAILIHFAFEFAIDHSEPLHNGLGLGSVTILLYMAVTLGAQRETVRLRASRLMHTAIPQ